MQRLEEGILYLSVAKRLVSYEEAVIHGRLLLRCLVQIVPERGKRKQSVITIFVGQGVFYPKR